MCERWKSRVLLLFFFPEIYCVAYFFIKDINTPWWWWWGGYCPKALERSACPHDVVPRKCAGRMGFALSVLQKDKSRPMENLASDSPLDKSEGCGDGCWNKLSTDGVSLRPVGFDVLFPRGYESMGWSQGTTWNTSYFTKRVVTTLSLQSSREGFT